MTETQERRKRGRPPLLKEYADPMKSPMAFSSLQMQKVTAATFTKPLMKVSVLGNKAAPSPKKRRKNSTASDSSSPGSVKKNRYRGVILATPVKQQRFQQGSSPLTPGDNVFSSEPRRHPIRSSPLEPECQISDTPPSLSPNGRKAHSLDQTKFNFSLCVGNDGKARIDGSPAVLTKHSHSAGSSAGQKSPLTGFDKSIVLGLLKKMKSNRKELSPSRKTSVIRPSEVFTNFQPSSPKQTSNSQPTLPWTPNCTAVFQLRTGFTPNNAIDEVLGPNSKHPESLSHKSFASRSDSAVFKFSSGDPLLMNDDPNTEFFVSHQPTNPSAEFFFQQLLSSPRKPLTYANAPPSLLTGGTSKFLSKQDTHNRAIANSHVNEAQKVPRGKYNIPTTPIAEGNFESSMSIQCTPLIQQTMTGSLNKLLVDSFGQGVTLDTSPPKPLEQDDARLALRKLIGGSN
ncbi:LANO_0H23838g1_1 [Lachancea nothofagi CBS 11611]|uniref:LANO_0H23838g1_1 n=1 Tax=Lachancea nothofagi CBS 11611 TaxID=1266666 RepID=A0A1G4KNZ7_9SACH|nr:LANO_0H23838g1_1 [Lachancea nothofagi CBS 11611]